MVLVSELKTGDVLLFYDPHTWLSWAIAKFSGARTCSHVAMVIVDPSWVDESGIYEIESGWWKDLPDVEDHENKYGVRMSNIKDVIERYGVDNIHVRQLEKHPSWTETDLKEAHLSVHNIHYDDRPTDWAMAFVGESGQRTTETFWCTALVAYLYVRLKLCPADLNWSFVTPAAFTTHPEELPLKDEVVLGHPKPITLD
jgi:hypothetical protein